MRLTTVLLIASLMQVSASSLAQKITLSEKNAPLTQIFEKIKLQAGIDFVVTSQTLKGTKPVSINVINIQLDDVLKAIFKDQPLAYSIEDKFVVVSRKTPSFLERLANRWAAIDVHGRVVDSENRPLPGASVKVKTTSKAVSTNAKGEFYLEKVDEGAVLIISFIGYVSKEVVSGKEMGEIVLELSDNVLDQVQVIAYGITSQRLSTGNVSTVKAVDIAKQPVNNPLLALTGRIPGLVISQANGLPGGGVAVQIQGQNSISKGNDPFYVIDGVPYFSQLLPNLGGVLQVARGNNQYSGNPLSYINPQDIESIEVLKDADATAIYGSRAANGAILITTKKGKTGETKVDVNMQSGLGRVTRKLNLLNTNEYLKVRKEAYSNDGIVVPDYNIPDDEKNDSNYDLTFWDQNKNTNWQKELIGNNTHYNDAQLTISSGNANMQFLAGAGYHKETTVFPTDLGDQKGSLHFNLNNTSNNQKFRFTLSGSYLLDNNKLSTIDLTEIAMTRAPNAPSLFNLDGSLNWARTSTGTSTINNPIARLSALYKNRTSNLVGNAIVSYELLPGLSLKSSFGYNNLQTDELTTTPSTTFAPENSTIFNREAYYGNNNINSWIVEPQISFKKNLGSGEFQGLLGSSIQQMMSSRKLLKGTGYNNDLVLENINAAKTVSVPDGTSIASVYKYNALFARLNYNWQDRYIINLTARRDGTSRFGDKNRFHNFGAIGAAWLFSNEKVLKNNFTCLTFGKLRASYGTTGSDQIDDYAYLSLYGNVNPEVPYSEGTGLRPTNLPNPYLQWEEVRKLSVGLDLGFFYDRLLFNGTYFRNRSSNQLLNYDLPPSTGFNGIRSNFPATVQNTGIELALNTSNIKNKNFSWSTGLNLTVPRNKLVAFENLENSSYADQYIIGQPISIVKVYKFLGVSSVSGLYEYLNNDGSISSIPFDNDRNKIVAINTSPTLYGGFQNSLNYNRFSLDVFFQFVKQKGNNYNYGTAYIGAFQPGNQPTSVLYRWQKNGDQNKTVQKYSQSDFNVILPALYIIQSDAAWTDASFIRLKNISLSWEIPELWKNKIHLQNARLYIQGQNLLTFTNYKGLDPETRSSVSLPPLQVLTLGTQITF